MFEFLKTFYSFKKEYMFKNIYLTWYDMPYQ